MNATELNHEALNPPDAVIRHLADELNREDSQLRAYLLDAALAGLRLARNPESADLRRDATRVWTAIEPTLSHHLKAEDQELLPWMNRHASLRPEAGRKIRRCHAQLRKLMGSIARAGTAQPGIAQARAAGEALASLAVNLDDAIDDEERRLFPTLRRALYSIGHAA